MYGYSDTAGPAGDATAAHRGWGCGGRSRWKPLEVAAVVVGFMVYWPIGVAMLGLKFAQRRGYRMEDAMAMARAKFGGFGPGSGGGSQWQPFAASSGNTAFDDWRKTEMERLEEERRKLDAAQREFADHLNNLRRAKDREEFDRFMRDRNAGQPAA